MTATLSIAIPYHGDRWPFVRRTLDNLAGDPRVEEVVIVEDASSPEHKALLHEGITACPDPGFMVRVIHNPKNLFVFRNKCMAVRQSRAAWVCLLDSDNLIDASYLDAWQLHRREGDRTVYLPEFARPNFDYRAYAGHSFTRRNIAAATRRPRFDCLLNTGNSILHRETFLRAMGPDSAYEPMTADSLWINYRLVVSGCELFVVPGMQYDHTVHPGGTWELHHHRGDPEARRLEAKFRELR